MSGPGDTGDRRAGLNVGEAAGDPGMAICPLEVAIRVIGGKWKMLILRALFLAGEQRYNSFLKAVPNISPKELTRNLRELERAGLVVRAKCGGERPDIGAYALTGLGANLLPTFKELGAFGRLLARAHPGCDLGQPQRRERA